MLHKFLNEFRFRLQIQPDGPILIKAGADSSGNATLSFVRTWRNGREEVFLPGSSLKGALRAHGERIARTLCEDSVCNLFNNPYGRNRANPSPWGRAGCYETIQNHHRNVKNQRRKHKKTNLQPIVGPELFSLLCPACQLFGSLSWAGRFSIGDAYLDLKDDAGQAEQKVRDSEAIDHIIEPEIRDGVAIDRFSGGAASSAKFQFEGLTDGLFTTTLILQNITWWQASWVALILRDLTDGMVTFGMGASRGLGRVNPSLEAMTLDLVGPPLKATIPCPALGLAEAGAYGFYEEPALSIPAGIQPQRLGIRQRLAFDKGQARTFLEAMFPRFNQHLERKETRQFRARMVSMEGGA